VNSYERVKEFHLKFGHPVADAPNLPEDDRKALRLSLILEEALELGDALGFDTLYVDQTIQQMLKAGPSRRADLVGVADALGDLDYVVNGAALEHGIDLPAVTAEIHRSNMTKLGPDGKPIYREDGKILKGEGYEQPNLLPILGL
jgi:predicted HAD superfamily Cof-like phosphohydrolase